MKTILTLLAILVLSVIQLACDNRTLDQPVNPAFAPTPTPTLVSLSASTPTPTP